MRKCEQCDEYLISGTPEDSTFCDQACLIRFLVATKRVTRNIAMLYVKQRLMGRPCELLYRL